MPNFNGEYTLMNIEYLRKDLINYFGTAMSFMPMAMMEIEKIENADEEELIKIAKETGFNLSNY